MLNRPIRLLAWIAIVAYAVFQAYAERYAISPDGISYLDLSDAVVNGRWGELVNLYWSPLYPFVIGVARRLTHAGPETEVAVVHAVNVVGFLAFAAAYDYLLVKVFELAIVRRGVSLRGAWGTACAYGLFAAVVFTMNPLELTTPDLFSNAAILVVLGALLRFHHDPIPNRKTAVVIGVALGVGALAKSFLVPWAIVCFAVMAIDLRGRDRRRGRRDLAMAAGVWLLFAAPWTAVLSARAGRLTFGDAGRLTYAWYVNGQQAPSFRTTPLGARSPDAIAILPGIGITGDAPGTDPMWFDPARWNVVSPHFSLADQFGTTAVMSSTFAASINVFMYLLLVLCIAPKGSGRRFWRDSWVVIVPCLLGIAAYLAVIMTSRYVIAFVLAGIVVSLGTIPIARRIRPSDVVVGLVLSIAPIGVVALKTSSFSFVVGTAMAMLVGALVPTRWHIAWMVVVPLALMFSVLIFGPTTPLLTKLAAAVFPLAIWVASRGAIRRRKTERFAYGLQMALAVCVGLVIGALLVQRIGRDVGAAERAESGSPEWLITQDLRRHGIQAGTRIALIGPHAESYWARTARLRIVANVPDPLAPFWWIMPAATRDSALMTFARHDAQVAIATRPSPIGPIDSSWTPLNYGGWMRWLSHPSP